MPARVTPGLPLTLYPHRWQPIASDKTAGAQLPYTAGHDRPPGGESAPSPDSRALIASHAEAKCSAARCSVARAVRDSEAHQRLHPYPRAQVAECLGAPRRAVASRTHAAPQADPRRVPGLPNSPRFTRPSGRSWHRKLVFETTWACSGSAEHSHWMWGDLAV